MSNIDLIKEQLDIVALASSITSLRRSGRSLQGLCPFHSEKTPSFYVFPRTNRYKCFGCGASGSALDLYAQIHHLSFGEAVCKLEHTMGLTCTPSAQRIPFRAEEFRDLGLHAASMRKLYAEDIETFRFILLPKVREKMDVFQSMMDTLPSGWMRDTARQRLHYYEGLYRRGGIEDAA